MPIRPKLKLLLPALVISALLALPAGAGATLSYVKNPFNATVFVANDDGSGARKVATGHNPHVAPDGLSVAYLHEGPKGAQALKLAPAAGGAGKTLLTNVREASYVAWSPDSKTIAALRGPELGKRKLVLIDVATGLQRVVAQGFFSGFSFSPIPNPFNLDSPIGQFVYAKSNSEKYPPRSDVFRVPLTGGEPTRITTDHRSSNPLFGPNNKIAFVKTVEGNKRRYGGKNELFLMNAGGKEVTRLTHTKVDPLLQGLFPTQWSADGSRLLAEFEGQDVSYAVTVNPKTGAQRTVLKAGEQGFVGTDLSADGKFVLGYSGGFDPGVQHLTGFVNYGGGPLAVLAANAFEPSWNR